MRRCLPHRIRKSLFILFSQACCTYSVAWSGWLTVSVLLQRFLVRDTQYYMLTQQNQAVLCMTQRHKHPMKWYLQVLAATRHIVVSCFILAKYSTKLHQSKTCGNNSYKLSTLSGFIEFAMVLPRIDVNIHRI